MAARAPRLPDRSRVIAALKLILPLSALGLLSMVFLLASPVDPTEAIRTAEIDVEERARDPRLSAARFAGVTDDGAALRIEAGAARSDPGGSLRFHVEDLGLWLRSADGDLATARADLGEIDRNSGRFAMSGSIVLQASPGYRLTARRIEGLLDSTLIEVEGPVFGDAPAGRISAGRLVVSASETVPGANRLVFQEGVSLYYVPEPSDTTPDTPAPDPEGPDQ